MHPDPTRPLCMALTVRAPCRYAALATQLTWFCLRVPYTLLPPAVHPVQYMTHAVNIPAAYKRVGGQWDALLHNVAFPLMAFNDDDMRLWAEDPHEYIRKVGRQDVRT